MIGSARVKRRGKGGRRYLAHPRLDGHKSVFRRPVIFVEHIERLGVRLVVLTTRRPGAPCRTAGGRDHRIALEDFVAPLEHATVIASGRDQALVESRPTDIGHVRRVAAVLERTGALLHRGITEKLHLSEVVSGGDQCVRTAPCHGVHVGTVGARWPNTLHRPAERASPGGPLLVAERASGGDLAPCGDVREEEFVRAAVALEIHALAVKIKVRNV
mmetsp:Transcript_20022/g.46344  ORF Transcript_20022/g.46344 Transcript_20022/m.46344 type:complete len:216 (+) Transcript_20022:2757-3404(+)